MAMSSIVAVGGVLLFFFFKETILYKGQVD